jgi:hypothetical protein
MVAAKLLGYGFVTNFNMPPAAGKGCFFVCFRFALEGEIRRWNGFASLA